MIFDPIIKDSNYNNLSIRGTGVIEDDLTWKKRI